MEANLKRNLMANPINKANTSPRPFYSLEDVAERYGVSIRTVRRWIKKGDLIAHRFGHQYRVSAADLETFERLHREG